MNNLKNILDENPKSADLLRAYLRKAIMMTNLDDGALVSIAEYVEALTADNESIANTLQENYRFLFDFFDINKLIISILYDSEHKVFRYRINKYDLVDRHETESNDFSTRKEAEAEAVNYSFKTLEAILCETE